MIRKFSLVGMILGMAVLVSACGTQALPPYEADATGVSVARTETREALIAAGSVPTDTPTLTPSPTVDFEATNAVIQATDDALATLTAEFEMTAAAEEAAAEAAQATTDAQATLDAEAASAVPGSDDPIFDLVQAADPANGETIFNAMAVPTCSSCHLISDQMLVGPGQLNLVQRSIDRIEAGTIVADGPYSYIYTSIVAPGDYIVEGYANAMPATYADTLTDEQVYDLIAYLATLSD